MHIYIYTYIILILYVFHLDLDRMRSNICLFFDYSYNCTTNCELFYVYGYTYLSTRARVINWFERARKRKLGKKTREILKDEVWRMIQKLHTITVYIYTVIDDDKKQQIGVKTLTHCIMMMNTTTMMRWYREEEKKSIRSCWFQLYSDVSSYIQ
jgi:hypothetical protein